MSSPISTRRHGDVLIVLSNNPPVNALSTAVRQGLVDAIAEAEADDGINAVVVACEGQTFFAGADITEFGKPPQQPWLPMVVDAIENCSKPVVAAIHGTALGGGLEIALGCHYRVADASAKLGTPEVKLGLLPGAGGTQRLPRVAGVRKALEMTAHRRADRRSRRVRVRARRPARRGRPHPARRRLCRGGARRPPAAQILRAAGQDRRMRSGDLRRRSARRTPASSAASRRRTRTSARSRPRARSPMRKASSKSASCSWSS